MRAVRAFNAVLVLKELGITNNVIQFLHDPRGTKAINIYVLIWMNYAEPSNSPWICLLIINTL